MTHWVTASQGFLFSKFFHILPADHIFKCITAATPLSSVHFLWHGIAVKLTIIDRLTQGRKKIVLAQSGFKTLSSNWTLSEVQGAGEEACSIACYSQWIRKRRARPKLGVVYNPQVPTLVTYDHHLGPRPPNCSASWRPSVQYMSLCGMFQTQTIAKQYS